MDKISVIIPVYKVENYLERCVRSVCNQTYPELEILLIDDGSPDRSGEICDVLAGQDARIRVIHKSNGGLSDARNAGIDASTGDWLAFVDSDDWLDPRMLEILKIQAEKYGAEIAECSYRNLYKEMVKEETSCSGNVIVATPVEAIEGNLDWKNFKPVAWNKLYKRELFAGLRYAEGKRYEDQFLLHGLLARCKTIACLGYPGYRYVQRGGSIMAQGSSRNYLDRSEFLLEWCAYFAGKGDVLRAEGLLNDAIRNLSEKERFDLSTKGQQVRYRTACRGCADAYRMLARRTGQRSMALRAFLLRLGLPVYLTFLQSRQ